MHWTLDGLPQKEPQRLNDYFLAVGKALCLATNFEHTCRFVLSMLTLVEAGEAVKSLDAANRLLDELDLKAKMLGGVIHKINGYNGFSTAQIETLRAAKNSRNYIAHESAAMGPLSMVRAKFLDEQIDLLHFHVEALAKGDNLAARWCHEIFEREPLPTDMEERYVKSVKSWINHE